MKTILLIFGVFSVAVATHAQTNLTFDVLTTAQGNYTNAVIASKTSSVVFVRHEGGVARVAITNLSVELQTRLGYNPAKAAAAEAAEKIRQSEFAKVNAARAQYLASLRGTNQVIRVVAVLDAFGQCQTSVGSVYLLGLPASVSDYLQRYNQLKSDVANYAVQVKNLARAADRANAVVPNGFSGSADYVNALAAQRHQVNNMALDAKDAAQNLTEMKTTLAQWQDDLVKNTTVVAYPNGRQYCGLLLWQCVNQ